MEKDYCQCVVKVKKEDLKKYLTAFLSFEQVEEIKISDQLYELLFNILSQHALNFELIGEDDFVVVKDVFKMANGKNIAQL